MSVQICLEIHLTVVEICQSGGMTDQQSPTSPSPAKMAKTYTKRTVTLAHIQYRHRLTMTGALLPSAKPLTPSTSRLGGWSKAQTHIPVHEEIKSVSLHGAVWDSSSSAIKYDRLYFLLLKWFFLPCPIPLFKSKRGHIFPFITEVSWMRNQGLFASSHHPQCWETLLLLLLLLLEMGANKFHHDSLYPRNENSFFDVLWQAIALTRLFITSINGDNAHRISEVAQKNR